jgi:putative ABC transport system ATP-binding protein
VTPAIAARGVHLAFPTATGTLPILRGVDLEVGVGELVAVAGRSGSGKTTFLLTVAGLEQPDEGEIRVLDRPAEAEHPWHEVAILPQSLGLLDELTVEENVLLPGRLSGRGGTEAGALLERLGLDHLAARFPSEISLGEQQRAALARAVVVSPQVLLADEPVSHQNHEWADVMMAVLGDRAAAGTACLLATHNEIAFASADRVLELRSGRLEER